jgi:hypothetical protein
MPKFEVLKSNHDLKEIINSAFNTELDISGSWGYTQALATVIHSTTSPLVEFEHIFASMRAYTEMNMTREKDTRYGSINVNELSREQISIDGLLYDKVEYKITAMLEETYSVFINQYKENYGKENFDLAKHFQEREESTLTRVVTHWFEIHNVL